MTGDGSTGPGTGSTGAVTGSVGGPVLYAVKDRVARITLDRPEKRNALNKAVVEGLRACLDKASEDSDVVVVLLRGNGSDFCSGADLAELEASRDQSREASLEDASRLADLFRQMRGHRCPVVGAVHGRALAGGAGLATACDLVVASDSAELGYPEVHLGFVPAMVMTLLRRKLGESRVFELAALGNRISAQTAKELGLVNRVLPDVDFSAEAEVFAEKLAGRPASALELTKRLLYDLDGLSFDEGLKLGAEVNVEARFTEACREGVRRFLERASG